MHPVEPCAVLQSEAQLVVLLPAGDEATFEPATRARLIDVFRDWKRDG